MKKPGKVSQESLATIEDTELHKRIRDLIIASRKTVARGVDLVQIWTNFKIGKHIVEHEQNGKYRAAYGEKVIKSLAERLTGEFGNGFSMSNLKSMRQFYQVYLNRIGQTTTGQFDSSEKFLGEPKSQSATGQSEHLKTPQPFTLSWTHYVFLLGIKNEEERKFYEIEATSQNWAVRELKRQFDSSLYERLALSRDKAGIRKLSKVGQIVSQPKDLLKEPLVLEFLGLNE
jgi:hypothetical protein